VVERGGRLAAEEEVAEGGVVRVGAGGGGGRGLEDAAEEVGVRGPGGGGARGRWVRSGGGGGGVVGHFFRPRAASARAGERSEGDLGSRAGVHGHTEDELAKVFFPYVFLVRAHAGVGSVCFALQPLLPKLARRGLILICFFNLI
jgi:hypothetical protein